MKRMLKNSATILTMVFLASTLIGCGDSFDGGDQRKMSEKSHRMSNSNPNNELSQRRERNTDPSPIVETQHKMKNTDPSPITESQHKMKNADPVIESQHRMENN
ncbi:MAG: hypothetical protein V3U88_04785 [Methylococcales bacterium]